MEINWVIIALVAVAMIILVVYLVRRNEKDKDKLVKKLNKDFKKDEEVSEPNDR